MNYYFFVALLRSIALPDRNRLYIIRSNHLQSNAGATPARRSLKHV